MPVAKKRKRSEWFRSPYQFRLHGRYCGPNWSGGKWQGSIKGKKGTATDEFDESCRIHDAYYADTTDEKRLAKADMKFARANFGKSFKRTLAAIGVGAQGIYRHVKSSVSIPQKETGDQTMARGRTPRRRSSSSGRSNYSQRSMSLPTPKSDRKRLRPYRSLSPLKTANAAVQTNIVAGRRPAKAIHTGSFGRKVGHKNRRITPLSKMMKNGVQVCLENGAVVSTSDTQYIGHCAVPVNVAKKAFFRALVKMILKKAGKLNVDWNAAPHGVSNTDTFVLQYRANSDPGSPLQDIIHTYTFPETQEAIALAMAGTADAFSSQWNLVRMEFRPRNADIGMFYIYLTNAHVEVDSISEFKIQNQSVTLATDDSMEDVNNVPLQGRCYAGRGTGSKYQVNRTSGNPFIADPNWGVITHAGVTNDLAEPPSGKLFQQVTSTSKLKIGPGEVVTSKIRYRKKLGLQNFINLIYDNEASLNPKYKLKHLGEFKFYGLEKMIDAIASTAENDIRLAYEHDLKFAMQIVPHAFTVTTTIYDQAIGPV